MQGLEQARKIVAGSIMQVCIGGSIGKCQIIDHDVTCNQQISTVTPIEIISDYLLIVMQSDYFFNTIKSNAGGTATPIINKTSWGTIAIPIPPLSEQSKIVEKYYAVLGCF